MRVNSKLKKETKFRRWATNILNQYLLIGYALNKDKLQQQKLIESEKLMIMPNINSPTRRTVTIKIKRNNDKTCYEYTLMKGKFDK